NHGIGLLHMWKMHRTERGKIGQFLPKETCATLIHGDSDHHDILHIEIPPTVSLTLKNDIMTARVKWIYIHLGRYRNKGREDSHNYIHLDNKKYPHLKNKAVFLPQEISYYTHIRAKRRSARTIMMKDFFSLK
ncbi:hypothetical protein ACJX0J_029589, partial [Zea mays]